MNGRSRRRESILSQEDKNEHTSPTEVVIQWFMEALNSLQSP